MFFGKKVTGPAEWLLVCLGNYGKQYENTRHNIGFMAAERLIDKQGLRCNRLRFRALTELIEFGGARVLLMMPQTYMNLSGEAVGEAARFYKIPSDHVLVIYDDVSLPLGKLRIRDKGSAGGHNGIKNIIAHLGTDVFPRVKVGVGAPSHPDYDMVDWVIGSFSAQERKIVDEALDRRAEYLLSEKNVEAQKYRKRMERGKRLPTVAVGAGYLYYNVTDKDVDDSTNGRLGEYDGSPTFEDLIKDPAGWLKRLLGMGGTAFLLLLFLLSFLGFSGGKYDGASDPDSIKFKMCWGLITVDYNKMLKATDRNRAILENLDKLSSLQIFDKFGDTAEDALIKGNGSAERGLENYRKLIERFYAGKGGTK